MIPDRLRTLADVERFLATATNYEEKMPREEIARAFDLTRMRDLLAAVGNPQDGPATLHVTGSKGKGSTCRMADAVLRAAGLGPVGLYASPHVERLTERVCVDGAPVPDEELAAATEALLPALRSTLGTPAYPTFFEVLTAAAHVAFRARGVRTSVLEVGIGGRLDATTVCRPSATAITTVELEHTKVLGDTLEKIAHEKAGILKPGVPCVTAVRRGHPALPVIEARAREMRAPLHRLGAEVVLDRVRAEPGPRLSLRVSGPAGAPPLDATLPVAGAHQAANAAVAAALCRLLRVDDEAIRRGLAATTLPARMETVLERPRVVVDGAHTPASARASRAAVRDCFPHRRLHLVLGVLEEKDLPGILAPLLEGATTAVACEVASPRALPAERLARAVRATAPDVAVGTAADAAEGLARALDGAAPDDLVLVSGSLYLAGAARSAARRLPGFLPRD